MCTQHFQKVKDLGFDELGERATCSGSNSVAGISIFAQRIWTFFKVYGYTTILSAIFFKGRQLVTSCLLPRATKFFQKRVFSHRNVFDSRGADSFL